MRTILTSSSLLALGAWAPALVVAATFQPTPAIGDGVFQALTRLGPTATPFCLSLLDLPRAITKTETFTPTDTIYVVVSTATVFDSSCITDAPIVPRAVAGEPNNLGQPGKYKPHFGKPGNYGQSGFDGILGDLLPKGLLPFPAGLISKACSELGRDVFPWKTTQTVFETAPADVTTVEAVEATTVCTGTVPTCVSNGDVCDPMSPGECCSGLCGTRDDKSFFCFGDKKSDSDSS